MSGGAGANPTYSANNTTPYAVSPLVSGGPIRLGTNQTAAGNAASNGTPQLAAPMSGATRRGGGNGGSF